MVTSSLQKDFRIQRVVKVLNQYPFHTLPQLAQNCQISTSRLSHLFKDQIGVNVKNYRLDCRLQAAAEMLVSSGMPIKEVAYTVGYRHSSSFVRAFKTHFGLSPAGYRRRQLEKAG
jgi:AraC family transcriptional regulator of arabinose operon